MAKAKKVEEDDDSEDDESKDIESDDLDSEDEDFGEKKSSKDDDEDW
ncbi:MAG: hypothetical protein Q7R52_03815 [archaeon]|nr:hypothetical protein [archaeon]